MTQTRQSFLIPQLNVVANDVQLKNLQNNLLNQHYKRMNQQRIHRSESQRKIHNNYHNFEDRVNTQMQYNNIKNSVLYNKSFGIDLAESYTQEIDRKYAKARLLKQKQKAQQQNIIKIAQKQLMQQRYKISQINQSFKRIAIQQMQQKQKKKAQAKKKEQQQKEYFQNRFSSNLMSLNKQQTFKKHYQNVNGSIQQNEKNYLSLVAPVARQKQQSKQKFIQTSVRKTQHMLRQQMQRDFINAQKSKRFLRESLVSQIREKEQKRKQKTNQQKSEGYTTNAYLRIHHPINNPIDFKITHDNKYIINELHSGLARSGSKSIMP